MDTGFIAKIYHVPVHVFRARELCYFFIPHLSLWVFFPEKIEEVYKAKFTAEKSGCELEYSKSTLDAKVFLISRNNFGRFRDLGDINFLIFSVTVKQLLLEEMKHNINLLFRYLHITSTVKA